MWYKNNTQLFEIIFCEKTENNSQFSLGNYLQYYFLLYIYKYPNLHLQHFLRSPKQESKYNQY